MAEAACKACGATFKRYTTLQRLCIPCAIEKGRKQQDRVARKARAEARRQAAKDKERLKTRSDWLREAQQAFNAYIRARDKGKPCVSCGRPDDGTHQRHASHYRSVGACSALRFNTWNVHASCAQCNGAKSGNIVEYRIRLVKRLGQDRVEWLEAQNQTVKYEVDYLRRLKKIFARRARMRRKKHG